MGYFDADAQEMLDVYLLETHQLIGQLADVLLETEKNGVFTGDDIHNIFRVMHTIKSSSAMMGLSGLSSLCLLYTSTYYKGAGTGCQCRLCIFGNTISQGAHTNIGLFWNQACIL